MCKQKNSNSFKNKIRQTNISHMMYIHLYVCKQVTDFKLLQLHSST